MQPENIVWRLKDISKRNALSRFKPKGVTSEKLKDDKNPHVTSDKLQRDNVTSTRAVQSLKTKRRLIAEINGDTKIKYIESGLRKQF